MTKGDLDRAIELQSHRIGYLALESVTRGDIQKNTLKKSDTLSQSLFM